MSKQREAPSKGTCVSPNYHDYTVWQYRKTTYLDHSIIVATHGSSRRVVCFAALLLQMAQALPVLGNFAIDHTGAPNGLTTCGRKGVSIWEVARRRGFDTDRALVGILVAAGYHRSKVYKNDTTRHDTFKHTID